MTSRTLTAVALVAALASTAVIVARADAQQGFGPRAGAGPAQMTRFSPSDRAAFLDAHIAAVKAGLQLTPDQDKLWPAVETAVRDGAAKMATMRDQARTQPAPVDPIERMRRMADAASARGDALHKIVDAAQPLYASLTDDQKHRLPMLLRGPRAGQPGMERPSQRGERGQEGAPPQRFGGQGPMDRGGRRPPPDAQDQERL